MGLMPTEEAAFRYVAVDRTGRQVRDVVRARDSRAAARALVAEGLTPISVTPAPQKARGSKDRDLNPKERAAVLRQLALMVDAGVGLLEAMQTVAMGIVAAKGRAKFEAAIAALKRGDTFSNALEQNAPSFPFYVYAMLRVGEATGQVGEVLAEASEQMSYEDRLKRDFVTSLTYPAFLVLVGIGAVGFIFTVVVPRFNVMLGDDRAGMHPLSRVVFGMADAVNSHRAIVLGLAVALLFAVVAAAGNRTLRNRVYDAARVLPGVGPILRARELTSWARLLGFALKNGVGLLEAAALARQGAPAGGFKTGLEQFERDLKGGVDVAESLGRHTELTAMDLSLLRAGGKSGTLPQMFLYVAQSYDSLLRDRLTRFSAVVQPVAILVIALVIAVLVVAIVLGLLSIYDNVDLQL